MSTRDKVAAPTNLRVGGNIGVFTGLLGFWLVSLSACLIDVNYSGTSFQCSDDACPPGFSCNASRCEVTAVAPETMALCLDDAVATSMVPQVQYVQNELAADATTGSFDAWHGDFSVAFVMLPTVSAFTDERPLVMKRHAGELDFEIRIRADGHIVFRCYADACGEAVIGDIPLAQDRWHYVSVERSGDRITIFQNAVPVAVGSFAGASHSSSLDGVATLQAQPGLELAEFALFSDELLTDYRNYRAADTVGTCDR